MVARAENESTPMKNPTTTERTSDRELVVTRTFNGPARIVFEAWTKPELFKQWWVPKSFGLSLLSCDMDVRTGGTYRLVFSHPRSEEHTSELQSHRDLHSFPTRRSSDLAVQAVVGAEVLRPLVAFLRHGRANRRHVPPGVQPP